MFQVDMVYGVKENRMFMPITTLNRTCCMHYTHLRTHAYLHVHACTYMNIIMYFLNCDVSSLKCRISQEALSKEKLAVPHSAPRDCGVAASRVQCCRRPPSRDS